MAKRGLWKPEDGTQYTDPPSFSDIARNTEVLSDDEYMCELCWRERGIIIRPAVVDGQYECPVHGKSKFVKKYRTLPEHKYDRDVAERRSYMKTGKELAEYKPSTMVMVPQEEISRLQAQIMYSLAGIKNFGAMTAPAASALANISLATGLNPYAGEIWIIPIEKWDAEARKSVVTDFSLCVGYKGWQKAAHKLCATKGTDFMFLEAEMHVLSPQEVEARGANLCGKCKATGKGWNNEPCKKCGGTGRFAPETVRGVTIPLIVFSDFETAKRIGLDPKSVRVTGIGIWQPGDNVASGRDAMWQAEKRARVDALRRKFDLPFMDDMEVGGRAKRIDADTGDIIDGEAVVIELPNAFQMIDAAGITYDDEEIVLRVFTEAKKLGCETDGHVIDILGELGIREIDTKNADAVIGSIKKEMTQGMEKPQKKAQKKEDKEPSGTDQASGKQKYQAQQALAALGIPKGESQNDVMKFVYDGKYTWSDIPVVALHNLVEYAKKAKDAKDADKEAIKKFVVKASSEGKEVDG